MIKRVFTTNIRNKIFGIVDITAKSPTKVFSPSWEIVLAYKNKYIDEKEYTDQYIEILRNSYNTNQKIWKEYIDKDELIFACFCKPNTEFCHRYILAEVFEKFNFKFIGELVGNEIYPPKRFLHLLNMEANQ